MKKFLRKLLPTIVMLAVSATLVGTSTFAWFSMNNKVTVTGMMVKTKVSSNLLIAEDTLTSTTRKNDSEFKNSLNQVVKGILEPASTADALNFFYTIDALANGAYAGNVSSEGFARYSVDDPATGTNSSAYRNKFSEKYDVEKSEAIAYTGSDELNYAVPYVDYVFQLKASNTEGSPKNIVVEELNLMYKGDFPTHTTAHRVAFFFADISGESYTVKPAASSADYKATYTVQSSANYTTTSSSTFNGNVVSGENTYVTASYVSSKIALVEVPANSTKYYKVVVRMWLEGQDITCNNETFMKLTKDWELGIRLALVAGTDTATPYINQIDSSAKLVNA